MGTLSVTDRIARERERIMTSLMRKRWQLVQEGEDGQCWHHSGLQVIWSAAIEVDGRTWLHVSVTKAHHVTPTYDDMKTAHELFVGDRYAYSVWAPAAKHVNIHSGCLHLWSVVDGDEPLPDFTRGGFTI